MQLHLQSMYTYTHSVNKSILLYFKTRDFHPFTVVIEECQNPIPTHALRHIKQLCILLMVVHMCIHTMVKLWHRVSSFYCKEQFLNYCLLRFPEQHSSQQSHTQNSREPEQSRLQGCRNTATSVGTATSVSFARSQQGFYLNISQ